MQAHRKRSFGFSFAMSTVLEGTLGRLGGHVGYLHRLGGHIRPSWRHYHDLPWGRIGSSWWFLGRRPSPRVQRNLGCGAAVIMATANKTNMYRDNTFHVFLLLALAISFFRAHLAGVMIRFGCVMGRLGALLGCLGAFMGRLELLEAARCACRL